MICLPGLILLFCVFVTFGAGFRFGKNIDYCIGLMMGFSAAILVPVVSTQILSLGNWLSPQTLAGMSLIVSAIIIIVIRKLTPSEVIIGESEQTESFMINLRKHRVLLTVYALLCLLIVALIFIGIMTFPVGDNYHYSRPYYWLQNKTILPFPVFNERITSFAPGADILLLPFYAYTNFKAGNVLLAAFGVLIVPLLVFSLCRNLGFAKLSSLTAAVSSLGVSQFITAIASGKQDIMTPTILIGGSFVALLDARDKSKADKSWVQSASVSMFLFAMAAGLKDPIILLIPGYLTAFIILLHKPLFRSRKAVVVIALAGLIATISSGAVWRMTANQFYYGNMHGPRNIRHSSLSRSNSPHEIWTRILRGATFFGDISIPLPAPVERFQLSVNNAFLRSLGAKKELKGETAGSFFSFDENKLPTRKGLGPLGLLMLASLGVVLIGKRQRNDENYLKFVSIGFFCVTGFVLIHATVRWSIIGRMRFAHALALMGCSLLPVIVRTAWMRHLTVLIAVGNAFLCFFAATSIGLVKMSSDLLLLDKIPAVKQFAKRRGVVYQKILADGGYSSFPAPVDFTLQDIYEDITNNIIKTPAVIGYISSFSSEDYFLFGKKGQHKVIPLVASDRELEKKLMEIDFIVQTHKNNTEYISSESFPLFVSYHLPESNFAIQVFKKK